MKKRIISLLIAIMLLVAFAGCQDGSNTPSSSSSVPEVFIEENLDFIDVSSNTLTAAEQAQVNSLFYENNFNLDGADPACVFNPKDDYFYIYTTGHWGFAGSRSKDFINWESTGRPFNQAKSLKYSDVSSVMTEAEFNEYKNNTWLRHDYDWAPGVIYDEELDLYLMFFSAKFNPEPDSPTTPMRLQLALATSKSPSGPFIQWTGKVNGANGDPNVDTITYANGQTVPAYELGYEDVFIDFEKLNGIIDGNYPYEGYIKAIDIEPFVDPVTGDKYIYFCRDLGDRYTQSCSMGIKMIDWFTPDYSTLTLLTKPNHEKVTDAAPYPFEDEGDVNEGQYVVYNPENQLYYLTYSCNGYMDRSYRVKQAYGPTPLGPFTKISNRKGGNVVATDLGWNHRSGTGHHVFTRIGGELFIVYHMHTNPVEWDGRRCLAIDKVNWVENEDGMLVMNCGGPSYDYRLKPTHFTGYKNVADKATVTVSQQKQGADLKYLTDGAIQVMFNEGVYEFEANRETLEVTLSFATPTTVKGVMAFNSFFEDTAFESVRSIQVEYIKNGEKYRATTQEELMFDWDRFYYDNLDSSGNPLFIPGCSSTAVFYEDIQNVTKIKINFRRQAIKNEKPHIPTGLSVSEIMVIGK